MTETTPFFQSWIFDLILLFGGAIFGFFVAAMCASSGQASRDEERWEEERKANLRKPFATGELDSITKGKPDRD